MMSFMLILGQQCHIVQRVKGYFLLSLLKLVLEYIYSDALDINFGTTISYSAAYQRISFLF